MKKNQLRFFFCLVFLFVGFFWYRQEFVFGAPEDTLLKKGSLVRSQKSSLYYVGTDGKLHPFLHPSVLHSWYDSVSSIEVISEKKLRDFSIGEPVCVRAGTWLLKFEGIPRVYAVEPGCQIRPLRSETEAVLLYGPVWLQRVIELDMLQSNFYIVRSMSVADPKLGIIDKDGDGVSLITEREQGTSDGLEDSDGDEVSDYEEIHFWLTDPTKSDTDGDGKSDGEEMQSKRSPTGSQVLTGLPVNSYRLPRGATNVVRLFTNNPLYPVSEEIWSPAVDINKPTITRQGQLMSL